MNATLREAQEMVNQAIAEAAHHPTNNTGRRIWWPFESRDHFMREQARRRGESELREAETISPEHREALVAQIVQ